MRAIRRQRETFCYRVAETNEKKKNYFDLNPLDTKQDLNAQREGWNPDKYNNAGPTDGPRTQKMDVTQGMGRPGGSGGGGGGNSSGGGMAGNPDGKGILPNARGLYDQLMKEFPGSNIGGYRVDNYHEHDHGAMDFMTTDPNQAAKVRSDAFAAGAPYVLWQQRQWNSDGTSSAMDTRPGGATANHYDHVHIAPFTPSAMPTTTSAPAAAATSAAPMTAQPTTTQQSGSADWADSIR